jgi:hypothetical protein
MRGEYDRLIEQSPPVPAYVIKRFERKFPEKIDDAKTRFSRPDIMFVRPIDLFDSSAERKKTAGVIKAFRKRVQDHRMAGTLNPPLGGDEQHGNLITELSALKGMGKVSERFGKRGISELVAATVELEEEPPISPSAIVVEQPLEVPGEEVVTQPGSTETAGSDIEIGHP